VVVVFAVLVFGVVLVIEVLMLQSYLLAQTVSCHAAGVPPACNGGRERPKR
jgi:uncharacterized membrane protein